MGLWDFKSHTGFAEARGELTTKRKHYEKHFKMSLNKLCFLYILCVECSIWYARVFLRLLLENHCTKGLAFSALD